MGATVGEEREKTARREIPICPIGLCDNPSMVRPERRVVLAGEWQYRRGGQRATKRPPFTGQQFYAMGRHGLMGTVRYLAQAPPRRSSLSRVPEDGMYGLKGGPMARGRV
jgi:hypothetical protein